jgi:hypothetical protein
MDFFLISRSKKSVGLDLLISVFSPISEKAGVVFTQDKKSAIAHIGLSSLLLKASIGFNFAPAGPIPTSHRP